MPYQIRWVQDKSLVRICEKSRRIGLSWADAGDAALEAARVNGCSTYYIGYNRDMASQYIEDAAYWAKAYNLVASEIEEEVLQEGRDILTYKIRFSSGHKITALSSSPANLRAKKGRIIIDEAAHHADLDGLLKAAIAICMWGGRVSIVSTHHGEDNPFNQLVQRCKNGELNYSLHSIPFQEALDEGLYRRICLVTGKDWSPEGEEEWANELYDFYGVAAIEELDCIPFAANAGNVFHRDWFEVVDSVPTGGVEVRFWDLAATTNAHSCYTAGVKMRYVNGTYYVLDVIAEKVGPAEGNELIVRTAQEDGRWCRVRWELEGGSAGIRDAAHIKSLLRGFDANGVRPLGDKVTRAKPMASDAYRGKIKVLRNPWNQQYLNWLHQFPEGTVKDVVDASSGAYATLSEGSPIKSRVTTYRYS